MVAHVTGLAPFDTHAGVDKGFHMFVVGLYSSWLLWMAYSLKGSSDHHFYLRVVKEAAALCFCCRAHYVLDEFTLHVIGGVMGVPLHCLLLG